MIERMDLQGLRLLGVPLDHEGIRLDVLERLIQMQHPRLLYTVPTFHNPTGTSMSVERRRGLLDLAARYNLLILEDDIYGLLSYDGPALAPLKAFDTTGLVIYLTSFSKVLMPGLRLGLLAAAPPILDALVAAKRLADLHAPQLIQRAFAEYLSRGGFPAHVRAVRALYRERRDLMSAALRRAVPAETTFTIPAGGLCLWLGLPQGVRALDFYLEAIDRGVACTPGEAFYADQPTAGFVRLSFAAVEPDAIRNGVAILGNLLHEQVARQSRLQRRLIGANVPLV
jgi:DNA-binding transcriptional MocR family regulator